MEGDHVETRNKGGDSYRDGSTKGAQWSRAIGYNDGIHNSGVYDNKSERTCRIYNKKQDSKVGGAVCGRSWCSCEVSSNYGSHNHISCKKGTIGACLKNHGSGSSGGGKGDADSDFKKSESFGSTQSSRRSNSGDSNTATGDCSIEKNYIFLLDDGTERSDLSGSSVKNYDCQAEYLLSDVPCNRPRPGRTDTTNSGSFCCSSNNSNQVGTCACCDSIRSLQYYIGSGKKSTSKLIACSTCSSSSRRDNDNVDTKNHHNDSTNCCTQPDPCIRQRDLSEDRINNNSMCTNSYRSASLLSTTDGFSRRTDFLGSGTGVDIGEAIDSDIGVGSCKGAVSGSSVPSDTGGASSKRAGSGKGAGTGEGVVSVGRTLPGVGGGKVVIGGRSVADSRKSANSNRNAAREEETCGTEGLGSWEIAPHETDGIGSVEAACNILGDSTTTAPSSTSGRHFISKRRVGSGAQSRGRRKNRERSESSRLGGDGSGGVGQRERSNGDRSGTGSTSILPRRPIQFPGESAFSTVAATSNGTATGGTTAGVTDEVAATERAVANDVVAVNGAAASAAIADASWLSGEKEAKYLTATAASVGGSGGLNSEPDTSCSATAAFPRESQLRGCLATTGEIALKKGEEAVKHEGEEQTASTYILYLEPSPSCALSDRLDCHSHQVAALWGPDPAQYYPPHCSLSGFFDCRDLGILKKLLGSFFGASENIKKAGGQGGDVIRKERDETETAKSQPRHLLHGGDEFSSNRSAAGLSVAVGAADPDKMKEGNYGSLRHVGAGPDPSEAADARAASGDASEAADIVVAAVDTVQSTNPTAIAKDAPEAADITSVAMNTSKAGKSAAAAVTALEAADARAGVDASAGIGHRPACRAEINAVFYAKRGTMEQPHVIRGYGLHGESNDCVPRDASAVLSVEAGKCRDVLAAGLTSPPQTVKEIAAATAVSRKTAAARGVSHDKNPLTDNDKANASSSSSCECTMASDKCYCTLVQQQQFVDKESQNDHTQGPRKVWQQDEQQHPERQQHSERQQHQDRQQHDAHEQQKQVSHRHLQKQEGRDHHFEQPQLQNPERNKEWHQQQRHEKSDDRISGKKGGCNRVDKFDIGSKLSITPFAAASGAGNAVEESILDTRREHHASGVWPRKRMGLHLVGDCCCSARFIHSCAASSDDMRATAPTSASPQQQQGRDVEIESAATAQREEAAIGGRPAEGAAVQSQKQNACAAQAAASPVKTDTPADPTTWLCPLWPDLLHGNQRQKRFMQGQRHCSREMISTSRSSSVSTCSSASKCGLISPSNMSSKYKNKRRASAKRWNQRLAASSCVPCTRGRSSTRLCDSRTVMMSSRSSRRDRLQANSMTATRVSESSSMNSDETMRSRTNKGFMRYVPSGSPSSGWAGTCARRRWSTSSCRQLSDTRASPADGVSVDIAGAAPARFFRSFALMKLNMHTGFIPFCSTPLASGSAPSRCKSNRSNISDKRPITRTTSTGGCFFPSHNKCADIMNNSTSADVTTAETSRRNWAETGKHWGSCNRGNKREWIFSSSSPISGCSSTEETWSSVISLSGETRSESSSSTVGTTCSEISTCNTSFSNGKNSERRWCDSITSSSSSLWHSSSWSRGSDSASSSCSPKKADSPCSDGRNNKGSSEGLVVSTDDGYVVLCLSCCCLHKVMEQLQQKLQKEGKIRLRKKRGDHVTLASQRQEPSIREAIRAFYEAKTPTALPNRSRVQPALLLHKLCAGERSAVDMQSKHALLTLCCAVLHVGLNLLGVSTAEAAACCRGKERGTIGDVAIQNLLQQLQSQKGTSDALLRALDALRT